MNNGLLWTYVEENSSYSVSRARSVIPLSDRDEKGRRERERESREGEEDREEQRVDVMNLVTLYDSPWEAIMWFNMTSNTIVHQLEGGMQTYYHFHKGLWKQQNH